MSVADIAAAAVIVLSGVVALRLGLVRVVLGLGGWIGASLATIYGFSYAVPFARDWVGPGLIADVAASAALFVSTLVVLTLVSHAIAGSVRKSTFGALDRTLGMLCGLAIGAVIVCGGYVLSQHVLKMTDDAAFYKDARTLPLVRRGAAALLSLAPSDWGFVPIPGPDREEAFRTLLTPRTKETPPEPGYNESERREMDRLFRSQQ